MAAAGYVWQDPGDTISIQVDLGLVERLGAAVRQGLGPGPRGAEIGGFLLGRIIPGEEPQVLIEDFELAPCEYLRGESYTLSGKEQHVLGARLKRRRRSQVVGFFRSHTRPGLYLDQDDFAVFSRYFTDPAQVFLVVRPASDGTAVGGFFFWEDGEVNRRAPYRQFPFDSKRLGETSMPGLGATPMPSLGAAPIASLGATPIPNTGPRLAPVPVPKAAPRPARRTPPLSAMVVPVIAALFLVAALVVSQRDTKPQAAAVKASVPVEPLLPEPTPQVVEQAKVETPAAPEPRTPDVRPAVARKPKPVAAKPIVMPVPSVPAERPHPHQLDAPPLLNASLEGPVARTPALLPGNMNQTAPAPATEVTYDAPRGNMLRRALHKIEGEAFVPASPIRKVAPVHAPGSGEVDVRVFIDPSGGVTRAQLLTKRSDFAAASLEAARQWQFTPARKHDKPVASEMVLHFRY